jgi:hypothetical protein
MSLLLDLSSWVSVICRMGPRWVSVIWLDLGFLLRQLLTHLGYVPIQKPRLGYYPRWHCQPSEAPPLIVLHQIDSMEANVVISSSLSNFFLHKIMVEGDIMDSRSSGCLCILPIKNNFVFYHPSCLLRCYFIESITQWYFHTWIGILGNFYALQCYPLFIVHVVD